MVKRKEVLVIQWTDTAEFQFFSILNYWSERNKSTRYAEKLRKSVFSRLDYIAKHPYASVHSEVLNLRKTALQNYSIFFRVNESGIFIIAFWDNRQDPKKLFKLLNGI